MKIFYILFSLYLGSGNLFSQTMVITGRITDAQSGEPLPFGNIRILNTTLGTAAN